MLQGFKWVVFLCGFGLFSLPVYADRGGMCQRGGGFHHGSMFGDPHGNMFLDYADELKLTDQQIVKLNALRLEKRTKSVELKHQMYELRAEMNQLAHAEEPDRKKVEKKAEEVGKAKGEIIKLKAAAVFDARKVLTSAQQKKLNSIFDRKYHGSKEGGDLEKKEEKDDQD